jgi:hypothetical protein
VTAAILDTDHRVPVCLCPLCGSELDGVAGGPGPPGPGDITVCIICAGPLIFTADLALRVLTPPEFAALDAEAKRTLRHFMAVVRSIDRTVREV